MQIANTPLKRGNRALHLATTSMSAPTKNKDADGEVNRVRGVRAPAEKKKKRTK